MSNLTINYIGVMECALDKIIREYTERALIGLLTTIFNTWDSAQYRLDTSNYAALRIDLD